MGRAELHPQNSVHEEGHGVEAQGRHIDPTQACKQKGQNRLVPSLRRWPPAGPAWKAERSGPGARQPWDVDPRQEVEAEPGPVPVFTAHREEAATEQHWGHEGGFKQGSRGVRCAQRVLKGRKDHEPFRLSRMD